MNRVYIDVQYYMERYDKAFDFWWELQKTYMIEINWYDIWLNVINNL